MRVLSGSGLKMWLYFNKNQDGFRFALSQKACEEWGIKKDSYYKGISELIDKGYLWKENEKGNSYYFFEDNETAAYKYLPRHNIDMYRPETGYRKDITMNTIPKYAK